MANSELNVFYYQKEKKRQRATIFSTGQLETKAHSVVSGHTRQIRRATNRCHWNLHLFLVKPYKGRKQHFLEVF